MKPKLAVYAAILMSNGDIDVNLDPYERDKLYAKFQVSEEKRRARLEKKEQLKQAQIENARIARS